MGALTLLAQTQADAIQMPYRALMVGYAIFIPALLLLNYMTKSGVIARATTKEAIRQPVFLLMTALGLTVITINVWVPFFSLGDDTKMYIDCGLATVLICSLLHCVWTASVSVADEIEGKTAMTLLSKPINRRQFVFGKYIGIFQSALIMIAILGVVFFFLTYYKFHYDQKESAQEQTPLVYFRAVSWLPFQMPFMNRVYFEVARSILPGLTLIGMEVAVMTAVSVAISTRVPMMVNMIVCFAVFVIGNLSSVLVQSNVQNVFVRFFARLFATILPGLDHFNMSAAVSTGKIIPPEYIGLAGLYCLAYVAAMLMVGMWLFEDRDLA
ncbi:ABC transporter permease subunit [Planctomicrobium piriforme]|uniref:ABC-type transport system involved in multi-copper enzyme maturation, permease component n=1 Tax=Planctomicrobium piriforme TaxID=1576369 RepID=A0A1I3C4F7_9PLAN|nr:ABC transporter permease subunit [Planctomicrobium piriforme]SFH69465.1 ABC-type transport system involved in multi-copper enzyme maturation, permease component [Planctomicrobium piriforme]